MKNANASDRVRRILVVEDEPAISQVCRRVLAKEGFEVDAVENGASAQKLLGAKDYDLCLIDIMIPVMDGKQLYKWIGQERPGLLSRVIFTTGSGVSGDTKTFLEEAGRPFLPKPFNLDELRTVIRETLRQVEK
jgi:DNA-binding response OmpR family regulator